MNLLPVQNMTLQEKLQAINVLWRSIEQEHNDASFSPNWHKDELNKRLQAEASGEFFEDWETVKKELQELAK